MAESSSPPAELPTPSSSSFYTPIKTESMQSSEFAHMMPGHDFELSSKLFQQWQESQHCDLILSLQGGQLRAHSCVVAAFSPKIKTLLGEASDRFSPSLGGLQLQLTFDLGVLRCLLHVMYTGVLSFNASMVGRVLATARWMEMVDVVQLCQDFKETLVGEGADLSLTDDVVLYDPVDDCAPVVTQGLLAAPRGEAPLGEKKNAEISPPRKRGRPRKEASGQSPPKRHRHRKPRPRTPRQTKPQTLREGREKETERSKQSKGVEGPEEEATAAPKDSEGPEEEATAAPKDSEGPEGEATAAPKDSDLENGAETRPSTETGVPDAHKLNKVRKRGRRRKSEYSVKTVAGLLAAVVKLERLSPDREEPAAPQTKAQSDSSWEQSTLEAVNCSEEMDFAMGKTREINCRQCHAKFREVDKYFDHVTNHPSFYCSLCNNFFHRRANYTRHMRTVHTPRNYLRCGSCEFVAPSEIGLLTHAKTEHENGKPFRCDHPGCPYTARRYCFVTRHAEIHSETKNYVCNKCGQSFFQQAGLISHQRSCFQLQEFLCDLCGQAFNQVQSMRKHRRTIHFGEKPYLCRICGTQFSDHRNMTRHMRIHENIFPYKCPVCQQKFRHSNSLKDHFKRHPGVEIDMSLTGLVQRVAPGLKKARTAKKGATGHQRHKLSVGEDSELHCPDQSCSTASVSNQECPEKAYSPGRASQQRGVEMERSNQVDVSSANRASDFERLTASGLVTSSLSVGDVECPGQTNSPVCVQYVKYPNQTSSPMKLTGAATEQSISLFESTAQELVAETPVGIKPENFLYSSGLSSFPVPDSGLHLSKEGAVSPSREQGSCVEPWSSEKKPGYGLQTLAEICFESSA